MCPFCLSTIGLAVAGVVSTGGLTALAVRLSRKEQNGNKSILNCSERSSSNERTNQDADRNGR
jgi:hypothetical protein